MKAIKAVSVKYVGFEIGKVLASGVGFRFSYNVNQFASFLSPHVYPTVKAATTALHEHDMRTASIRGAVRS